MNSAVIITYNNYEHLEKVYSLFRGCHFFCLSDEELPYYKIDNRTKESSCKIAERQCSDDCIDEIKRYIKTSGIENIVFVLPNECLKLITEKFVEVSDLSGYIFISGDSFDANDTDYILYKIDLSKPRLRMVQINLAQHCNLNCKGCANYSNLLTKPIYSDYNQVCNDLKTLKKYFWGIETIKLMGGEPTLNQELDKYLGMVRMLYPDASVELATNGTRIHLLAPSVLSELKNNDITVVVSLYPNTMCMKEKIEKILLANQIKYKIYLFKKHFMKYLSEIQVKTKEEGYIHCPAKECHCLENGILAVCGRPLFIRRLNDRFGMHIPDQEGKIDIYSSEMTPWELEKWLKTPFETCSYCGTKEFFEWNTCNCANAVKSDWVIETVEKKYDT